jgi:hypothetical protein
MSPCWLICLRIDIHPILFEAEQDRVIGTRIICGHHYVLKYVKNRPGKRKVGKLSERGGSTVRSPFLQKRTLFSSCDRTTRPQAVDF